MTFAPGDIVFHNVEGGPLTVDSVTANEMCALGVDTQVCDAPSAFKKRGPSRIVLVAAGILLGAGAIGVTALLIRNVDRRRWRVRNLTKRD